MSTRGTLQLSRLTLSKNWVGRVAEVSDRPRRRHQLEQQLKALSSHFGQHEVDAGEISARPVELVNEANPDRVGGLHKNNRDRLGRGLGCKRTLCALQYNNHGYLTGEPIPGGRIRQPPCRSVIRSPASLVAARAPQAGHVAAAPPRRLMNSRRFMGPEKQN